MIRGERRWTNQTWDSTTGGGRGQLPRVTKGLGKLQEPCFGFCKSSTEPEYPLSLRNTTSPMLVRVPPTAVLARGILTCCTICFPVRPSALDFLDFTCNVPVTQGPLAPPLSVPPAPPQGGLYHHLLRVQSQPPWGPLLALHQLLFLPKRCPSFQGAFLLGASFHSPSSRQHEKPPRGAARSRGPAFCS